MIESLDWGLIDYEKALEKQLELVNELTAKPDTDYLVFCSHPSVVTLGRATVAGDLMGWDGPTYEVTRGGRATYHGPGQVVVYPLVHLESRKKDLHWFLHLLEDAMIASLAEYGIQAEGRRADATGVWIGSQKIASIGIAVKKWITYHGLALNLYRDSEAFKGISPCGFQTSTMVTLEDILGRKVDRTEFETRLARHLQILLS